MVARRKRKKKRMIKERKSPALGRFYVAPHSSITGDWFVFTNGLNRLVQVTIR